MGTGAFICAYPLQHRAVVYRKLPPLTTDLRRRSGTHCPDNLHATDEGAGVPCLERYCA